MYGAAEYTPEVSNGISSAVTLAMIAYESGSKVTWNAADGAIDANPRRASL